MIWGRGRADRRVRRRARSGHALRAADAHRRHQRRPCGQHFLFAFEVRLQNENYISAREVEELLRNGGDVKSLPADAIYTPSARDLLREFENNGASRNGGA